jgi:hypothetical protein
MCRPKGFLDYAGWHASCDHANQSKNRASSVYPLFPPLPGASSYIFALANFLSIIYNKVLAFEFTADIPLYYGG